MNATNEIKLVRSFNVYLGNRRVEAFKVLPNGKEHRRAYHPTTASLTRLARMCNIRQAHRTVFYNGWMASEFEGGMTE